MTSTTSIIPVILCGGSGTRLWPESRERHPKQFLKLTGEYSLLQETVRRALNITSAPPENLLTVTLAALEEGVRTQLSIFSPAAQTHILPEPAARNTAAAVALAALHVKAAFGGDAVMWVLPSDHHIGREEALAKAFHHGLDAAKQGCLVTFGIRPTRPDTGYGYINPGEPLTGDVVRRVASFVEKPDRATAQAYLDAGTWLWNSGMFLFRAEGVLAEFRQHAPGLLNAVEKAASDPALYAAVPKQPFDKAVMEKSTRAAVVPCDPAWSDIGTWGSLWDLQEKDGDGNVAGARAVCHDTKDCLIRTTGSRLVACAGLENLVIIETADALLIADRNNAEAMRALLEKLRAAGCAELLDGPAV